MFIVIKKKKKTFNLFIDIITIIYRWYNFFFLNCYSYLVLDSEKSEDIRHIAVFSKFLFIPWPRFTFLKTSNLLWGQTSLHTTVKTKRVDNIFWLFTMIVDSRLRL